VHLQRGKSQKLLEEGGILTERTQKSGRRTNKDSREEATNKEKSLGRKYSIEISFSNMGKKK
jgi:hypothetical protein